MDMDKLKIEEFNESMQNSVKNLILKGLGEHFGFIDETLNPDLNDIMKSYVEKGNTFLVAIFNGMAVGTGALIKEEDEVGRIVRVSVSKEYRRMGIAGRIIKGLENVAAEKGYSKILIETNNDWYDAIGFYMSLGYIEYDKDEESVHMYKNLI